MFDILAEYWPHILALLSVILGSLAAMHATMTKDEVRTALGWVGVILLSPIVGALVYAVAGVNRIRRKSISDQRDRDANISAYHLSKFDTTHEAVAEKFGRNFAAMKKLGDVVSRYDFTTSNKIEILLSGDKAYPAMLEAIANAKRSILLESYIFDRDPIGERFVEALAAAAARGIEVRVLIDAVGARYSHPSIIGMLEEKGVRADIFNGNIISGLKLPYANLRTHRKILIVDGEIAFTGGMNIRASFMTEYAGEYVSCDTHFCIKGPAVADLFHVSSEDWLFTTGELLSGPAWEISSPSIPPGQPRLIRIVGSGPDRNIETNHRMMIGAFSVAENHILIMTPYLLPDREFISALVTAARRGVAVDIIIPGQNNLKLVDRAMRAQFDQLLKFNVRIWRAGGAFNHSKLMTIDGKWSYVGSSNLDPRSLRLNFEVDMEVLDMDFAAEIEEIIRGVLANSTEVHLDILQQRPFFKRLGDRIIWLGSPYL